jgi:hypothetical protein
LTNTTHATIFDKKASLEVTDGRKKSLGNNGFDEIIECNVDVPQVTDVLMREKKNLVFIVILECQLEDNRVRALGRWGIYTYHVVLDFGMVGDFDHKSARERCLW